MIFDNHLNLKNRHCITGCQLISRRRKKKKRKKRNAAQGMLSFVMRPKDNRCDLPYIILQNGTLFFKVR